MDPTHYKFMLSFECSIHNCITLFPSHILISPFLTVALRLNPNILNFIGLFCQLRGTIRSDHLHFHLHLSGHSFNQNLEYSQSFSWQDMKQHFCLIGPSFLTTIIFSFGLKTTHFPDALFFPTAYSFFTGSSFFLITKHLNLQHALSILSSIYISNLPTSPLCIYCHHPNLIQHYL